MTTREPDYTDVRGPGARNRYGDTWPTNKWKARKRRRGDGPTARNAAA